MNEGHVHRDETDRSSTSASILVEVVDDQALPILDINGSC